MEVDELVDVSFSTGSEFIAGGGQLLGPVPGSSQRASRSSDLQADIG